MVITLEDQLRPFNYCSWCGAYIPSELQVWSLHSLLIGLNISIALRSPFQTSCPPKHYSYFQVVFRWFFFFLLLLLVQKLSSQNLKIHPHGLNGEHQRISIPPFPSPPGSYSTSHLPLTPCTGFMCCPPWTFCFPLPRMDISVTHLPNHISTP